MGRLLINPEPKNKQNLLEKQVGDTVYKVGASPTEGPCLACQKTIRNDLSSRKAGVKEASTQHGFCHNRKRCLDKAVAKIEAAKPPMQPRRQHRAEAHHAMAAAPA